MNKDIPRRKMLQIVGATGIGINGLSQAVRAEPNKNPSANNEIELRKVDQQMRITNNDAENRQITINVKNKVPSGTNPTVFKETYSVPSRDSSSFQNVVEESSLKLGTPGKHIVEVRLQNGNSDNVEWHVPNPQSMDNHMINIRVTRGEVTVRPVIA